MGLLQRLMPVATEVATSDLVSIPSYDGSGAQAAAISPSIAEAFGINLDSDTVSRKQAMTIPAVRRGRSIIAGTLGSVPLMAVRNRAGQVGERIQRPLLVQPDPNTTRQHTLTWTIDSLLFYGVAWWRVLAREGGFPFQAEWIAPHRIVIDTATGVVRIDGKEVPDKDLIRFDGPDEGVLTHGARALRTYMLLEEAVRNYSRMDIPLGYLEDELGQMEEAEVTELLDSWEAARKKRSTGYIPHGLKYRNPAFNAEQVQLGTARDFQAQEIARLLNLPAAMINAPTNDSLTYSTTESQRRELVDLTFSAFSTSVELRLSMDDVTPHGTDVLFDLGHFLRGDIRSVMETAQIAIDAGLMTKDEVRVDWLGLPPMDEEQRRAADQAQNAASAQSPTLLDRLTPGALDMLLSLGEQNPDAAINVLKTLADPHEESTDE